MTLPIKTLIYCIPFILFGCGYIETYNLNVIKSKDTTPAILIDIRTEKQKERNLSLFDNDGIYRFRDDGFRPGIKEYLSYKIPELNHEFQGKEIQITEFRVIQDHRRRAGVRRGSGLAGIIPQAIFLITNENEVPDGTDSIATILGLIIDDKEYLSIYAYPMGVNQVSSTEIHGKSILMHSIEGSVGNIIKKHLEYITKSSI